MIDYSACLSIKKAYFQVQNFFRKPNYLLIVFIKHQYFRLCWQLQGVTLVAPSLGRHDNETNQMPMGVFKCKTEWF